jgi:hypothetical protein
MRAFTIGALLVCLAAAPALAQNVTPEQFCNDARLKPIESRDCHTEMRRAKSDKERQRIMLSYYWVLNNVTPLRNDLRSDEAGVRGARRR